MIKINLLPQELAGRKSSAPSADRDSLMVAAVLIIIFALNIVLGGYVLLTKQNVAKEFARVKAESDKVTAELKETKVSFDDISSNLDSMRKLIQIAEKLDPPERVLWSRKLNALPLLVPKGVFLSEINVTQKINEVQTPESTAAYNEWMKKRKGPQPPIEKVPVISQTLVLRGLAYVENGSQNDRLSQINEFYGNLRDKAVKLPFDQEASKFNEGMNPTIIPSPVDNAQVQGRAVSTFTFTLQTKPMTIN